MSEWSVMDRVAAARIKDDHIFIHQVSFPGALISADYDQPVFENITGRRLIVQRCAYIPNAAVTGNAVNFFDLSLIETSGPTVIATLSYLAGVNMVKNTASELTINATIANRVIEVNEILEFDKTETAAGIALPPGIVVMEIGILSL